MSFQDYLGEVNAQIPGAEDGAQIMHLTQVKLARIVSSAVSQALTQHMQQTASNSPLAAAASTAAVQRYNPPPSSKYPRSRVIVQQVG